MDINNFDVVIEDNSYFIQSLIGHKNDKKYNFDINLLTKIELVVKCKMKYSQDYQDEFSKLSDDDLMGILKKKTLEIHNKISKSNWLARKTFNKEKQVNLIKTRIINYITPPQALSLSKELIKKVTDNLSVQELSLLSQLNRQWRVLSDEYILKHSVIKSLFDRQSPVVSVCKSVISEAISLFEKRSIDSKYMPINCIEIVDEKINLEWTIKNLKNLPDKDLIYILINVNYLSHDDWDLLGFLYNIFRENLRSTKTLSEEAKVLLGDALSRYSTDDRVGYFLNKIEKEKSFMERYVKSSFCPIFIFPRYRDLELQNEKRFFTEIPGHASFNRVRAVRKPFLNKPET